MANKLITNPITIDTFTSDINITNDPITVKKIVLLSAAAGDILSLLHGKHSGADECIRIKQVAALTTELDFRSGHTFPNGLYLAAAQQSGLDNGTDKVFIYTK